MDSSPSPNKAIPEKINHVAVPPLNCPRCGSSNTKFCYYNNYSLSQPRHLCRACKRYWTRGGALRNVPVGGGCRKDKRGKRRRSAGSASAATSSAANPTWQQHFDLPPNASSYVDNPLFYNLPTNPMELNFQVSRLMNSASVCSDIQMNDSGSGYTIATTSLPFFDISGDDNNNNNNLLVGSTSLAASSTSAMACLLASGFQQQKFSTNGLKNIQPAAGKGYTLTTGLMPNHQMPPCDNEPAMGKEVNEMDAIWNPIEPATITSDNSSVPWNSSNIGA